MENLVIQGRLSALREAMKAAGIQYYVIPTADFHNSEYVNKYFTVRKYFSGFTGSAGTLVVSMDEAGLWTDGRYFIQAANELEGTTVELFKAAMEGVPTIEEFLADKMKEGETLGFDGRVVSTGMGISLENKLADKKISFVYNVDLADQVWIDRPELPAGKVTVLSEELAGESVESKLAKVREEVAKEGADSFLLSKLDDLMWLYNIRGCDVACNPVALSYSYITQDEAILFIQEKALTDEVKAYFADKNVIIKEYNDIVNYLQNLEGGKTVLVDKRYCSYALYKTLSEKQEIIASKSPTELLKAIKNPVELANMKKVILKDSAAVTRFIYWVKKNIGKIEITEISAADKLEEFRREIPEFLDLSFRTISAYKANAAMMHYDPTPENQAVLAPEGMLLVDSGGQYMGGTTDITRTIVLGPISDEIKKHYTLVTAGMLQLSNAKWLYGCSGRNLDILARQPLWAIDVDYQCGTGHGVGYILNVHEGPQNLRWKYNDTIIETTLEAGMDVTNEPGVYIAGSYGIRVENMLVVKNGNKNEYGQFMEFETYTYAPIDLDAIDVKYLNDAQRKYLNDYHKAVYENVSPLIPKEEREWLKEATREI